jgi:hypothetical protein
MKFHEGFKDIKVKLIHWPDNEFAEKVYEFGRLSHDYNEVLPEKYNPHNDSCTMLIHKIIAGKTLPKFALQGMRVGFRIEGISRICLAQLTRDQAIFASQGGGVHALTQDFVLPLSITKHKDVMDIVKKAQYLLEEAYIKLAEYEVPALEARYIGLHCQTISLTASYTPADFVRSCFSRTSSNFCDECNYVYRLMYRELQSEIMHCVTDKNSRLLYNWIFAEKKCINDGFYDRERLYNSDFTAANYNPELPAINDWRKSGWKDELERMAYTGEGYITDDEYKQIEEWKALEAEGKELPTTYDNTQPDVLCNNIKDTDYYKEHRK